MKPLLFIHIPKAAGTSIIKSLGCQERWRNASHEMHDIDLPIDDNENLSFGHVDINEVRSRSLISDTQWNKYYKFCFVRNPWDRAVSLYEYIKKQGNQYMSFNSFVFNLPNTESVGFYNVNKFSQCQPQVKWIPEDIDYIGKVETIHSDIERISQILNTEITHPKKNNVTKERGSKHYHDYFPDTKEGQFLKDEVADFYSEDIKRFNYTF
ncbi:MAG: sulfotransferase family 2 domain-containing protein [Bacteroidetes bacterium]|nr:sulfotransferase family 2 domain-containing protein [Bacteroidota bacterium]